METLGYFQLTLKTENNSFEKTAQFILAMLKWYLVSSQWGSGFPKKCDSKEARPAKENTTTDFNYRLGRDPFSPTIKAQSSFAWCFVPNMSMSCLWGNPEGRSDKDPHSFSAEMQLYM